MIILKVKKGQIIKMLNNYDLSLGNDKPLSVERCLSRLKDVFLNQTENEARYLECEEDDIQSLLTEQIDLFSYHWNLCLIIFLGQNVQYNCKSILESSLTAATMIYLLPTNLKDKKVRICMGFFRAGFSIQSGIDDSAIQLLQYYD